MAKFYLAAVYHKKKQTKSKKKQITYLIVWLRNSETKIYFKSHHIDLIGFFQTQ